MLKIKLLNDGGYGDMENVKFPVIVEGEKWGHRGFDVLVSELNKHGAKLTGEGFLYFSLLQGECEVIKDDC